MTRDILEKIFNDDRFATLPYEGRVVEVSQLEYGYRLCLSPVKVFYGDWHSLDHLNIVVNSSSYTEGHEIKGECYVNEYGKRYKKRYGKQMYGIMPVGNPILT